MRKWHKRIGALLFGVFLIGAQRTDSHAEDNTTNILFIGVDAAVGNSGITGGMADSLYVYLRDNETGEAHILSINRDAITGVDMYDRTGGYLRTADMQIAFAHNYGNTEQEACENTVTAVEGLLKTVTIDHYVSLQMDGVSVINDSLGGVKVTFEEDLTEIDPAFVSGAEVVLNGEQALKYLRNRDTSEIDSTAKRIERQKTYIASAYTTLLSYLLEDPNKASEIVQEASPYIYSDLENQMLAAQALQVFGDLQNNLEIVSVPGEFQQGNTYAEYHVDEEALAEMLASFGYTE